MIKCICDYCGKVVKKYPSQVKNRVFCNKECCDLDRKERVNALNGSKGWCFIESVIVVWRHENGILKEFRLFKDPKDALKIRNKMKELYIEDSVEMEGREVE